ncbi:cobalamin biosynthesis protein [Methylocystis bryophila]|uniref:cobalamin biosynthesis protein n=1 Tax=Methylocystis bryophila TaxID=655015 RepID=UPI001FD9C8D2|nr:cobalamin biosynthesis protein [Methylocystis bryophila]
MTARLAIGVGGRRGVDPIALAALAREAAARCGVVVEGAVCAALAGREDEAEFRAASGLLSASFVLLPLEALRKRDAELLTRSPLVAAMFGVGSLVEALALAGAGEGSRLLAPRFSTDRLACAIAEGAA